MASKSRFIGIRHRRKKTKDGEARPTTVAIRTGEKVVVHDLATETDELDFLLGRLPVQWRAVESNEEVVFFHKSASPNSIRSHHCKWKEVEKGESLKDVHPSHVLRIGPDRKNQTVLRLLKVPTKFEGLQGGDMVGMVLGGSGDRYAAALSRRGEEIGATVWRIPPFALQNFRNDPVSMQGEAIPIHNPAVQGSKDDDHLLLTRIVETHRNSFYLLRGRDRGKIRVREALNIRQEAMKARIGCEQRILQSLVGRTFLSEEGRYPEGLIGDEFDRMKASDAIYLGLVEEEKRRDKELDRAVKAVEIWGAVFEPIVGCGPRLAAGLMAPIGDIRRFAVQPDPAEMDRLYTRSKQLEELGMFERDKVHVMDRIANANHFQQLQIVRSWQAANGHSAESQLLTEAIECHNQRHKLRQKAFNQGMAKLKKFCGVHCLPDGSFPRRRSGVVANWNPSARQALYLLGDQFNRRKTSTWGKKLVEYKLKLREKHPNIECTICNVPWEQCNKQGLNVTGPLPPELADLDLPPGTRVLKGRHSKRYTNGHIHQMAIWRTVSKFVEHLYKVWMRIEQEAAGKIPAPSSATEAA